MSKCRNKKLRACLVSLPILCLALTGACGDDPPPKKPPAKAGKGAAAKKPKKARGAPKRLNAYAKVGDDLRHEFVDRDFLADPSGDTNRDPFRSYLVNQPLTEGDEGTTGDATEQCPPERTVAAKYPLRSLKLIGIVLRGTRSYSLFRDGKRFGHIVRRGDCLGKEKAVISEIGVGYVRLEVTPEAPQGTAAPPSQTRTIALYPKEIALDALNAGGGDSGPAEPLPERGKR